MKLHVEESPSYPEVDITICCPMVDDELKELIEHARMYGFALRCTKEGNTYLIKPTEIYYIESIDDKTFIYTEKDVFNCDMRLYLLEDKLNKGMFIRISKSCIVNMKLIKGFRSQLNGKLEANMINGERVEVSRHYVAELKNNLKKLEVVR